MQAAAPTGPLSAQPPGWLATRYRPYLLGAGSATVALLLGALAVTKPKDAVALLCGVALVVAVLLRPLVGAVVLAAAVPITSGLASGFPVPHVRLSEALIGAVGVTLIVSVRRRHAVAWATLDWVLLAYGLAWMAFGVLADQALHQHLTLDQWGTVAGQLQFFLVYRGVRIGAQTKGDRRVALGALVLASLPVAALAVLQEAKAPGVASLIGKLTGGLTGGSLGSSGSGLLRVTGPFVNWAALAGYLLPVVLVVVALALARVDPGQRRRWFVAAGVLATVALCLTLEQSAIACGIAGVVFLVRRYDTDGRLTRWVLLGVAAAVVVASPFLVSRLVHELGGSPGTGRIPWVPQTLSFRWSVWTHQYLPAIGARPLTGYGVVLPSQIRWPFPESQYISFAIEGGLPMLAAFGGLAWAMVSGTLAAARSSEPMERALGLALTVAVLAMLVMDAMWPFLSNGGMPQVLWALMALAVPRGVRRAVPVAGWEGWERGQVRERGQGWPEGAP